MCGIAGCLGPGAGLRETASRMAAALAHRGPDDAGDWADANAGIALAHRRLSVLDLSPAGHQPMVSASGRYVIAFNGEIYNHADLRRELEAARQAIAWRGHSDTETLLAAIENWGLEPTLAKCVGMFALALWDCRERTLELARDRLGEKPLYHGRSGDMVLFASELKALRAHPAFRAEVDRDALALFLRHAYIPAPSSIYRGIRKLPPAAILRIDSDGRERLRYYWSVADAVRQGLSRPFTGTATEATDELERHLARAIGGQRVADVPLGAFLSGGIDSSTVVALMQAQATTPVRTFSIGFHEEGHDEARHARAVASHLGTAHTELYVTPREARDVITRLPEIHDEPFADSSQIPMFLVARLARRHVAVGLSGDGGDELFGGYNRYFVGGALWQRLSHLPIPLRGAVARALRTPSPAAWDRLHALVGPALPGRWRHTSVGDKLHKLAGVIDAASPAEVYRRLISHWPDPAALVVGAGDTPTGPAGQAVPEMLDDFVQSMMYLDTVGYLPDDILTKVDRAAMAVSLETRLPLLDHRIVEFAWSLPMSLKMRDGAGKWLLRQVLYRHVPRALVDRPKMGFGVPIDTWLRGPLRDWAESLLDAGRLRREGWLRPEPIRTCWEEHLSGRRNWQHRLWNVLMFQAWIERLDD
ncbi:MAG: asparagine synthase (glutamine-hydrolyzing) [Sulfurisoma sp.]|nr:asparagine synthase (glutamine-hydrolyzing) [Sulfurisoma sp.]